MLDVISNMGAASEKTLVERILRDFSVVKLKQTNVKVPNIKITGKNPRKHRNAKTASQSKKEDMPASSIVNILIKTALEKAKIEKKEKISIVDGKNYTAVKDDFASGIGGGYGTVSGTYGTAPKSSYADYGKMFEYLGKFRSKQPYENIADNPGALNKAGESGSFALTDSSTMDKIGRFEKYLKSPVMDMPTMALSLVPLPGFSSGEWEEIKMMMKLDPVAYTLKTKTA